MKCGERKLKYVAVGTGGRIPMFIDPIARDYKNTAELLALCDPSRVRMEYHRNRLEKQYACSGVKMYGVEDFDRMLDENHPDVVIVCTVDAFHHEYVVRSLERGCDVICEKPLTIDAEKCRAILDTVERTGRKVRVTFNYRWSPGTSKVREVLASGAIGKVRHVQMEYLLDTKHGADYFRRWHSNRKNSGGLLVHKSTHHFDLINWWIDGIPASVYAQGGLVFYGKRNAVARGDGHLAGYERYTGENAAGDPFKFDLKDSEQTRELYYNAEAETGYLRDRNVFREGIDIEDSMSLVVKYRDGTLLNYSLNAFSPWEGFRVSFNGDRGRLEYEEVHNAHIIRGQSDEELGREQAGGRDYYRIRLLPLFAKEEIIDVPKAHGGHGGGDALIQEQMFAACPTEDFLGRNAQHEQGAASILVGIAGNQSMASGLPVRIADLVPLRPDAVHLSELL